MSFSYGGHFEIWVYRPHQGYTHLISDGFCKPYFHITRGQKFKNVTMNELRPRKVLFLALWLVCFLFFLFVNQISPEPLNGFAPNSHGRRVWSLARTSLNVKVKLQCNQGQKNALYTPVTPGQRRNGPFCCMTYTKSSSSRGTIPSLPGGFWWPACGLCLVKHL